MQAKTPDNLEQLFCWLVLYCVCTVPTLFILLIWIQLKGLILVISAIIHIKHKKEVVLLAVVRTAPDKMFENA